MEHIKKNLDKIFLGFVLFISVIPRFLDLGYSNFYGDETKVLYIDKTVSAMDFFMNQRKAPLQFIVAWITEKLTGSFAEVYMRLPFAIAGILAVVVFYLLVQEFTGKKTAFFSTILFSFNGFSLAFARTVQYQSFLVLFGLFAIYAYLIFKKKAKLYWLWISAVSFALAFYCHYDAVFFLAPVLFLSSIDLKHKDISLKNYLVSFVLPLVLLVSAFYIPYTFGGFFEKNALGYLTRRLAGSEESLEHSSLYTFRIYNPLDIALLFIVLLAVLGGIYLIKQKKDLFLIIWFLLPFSVFEFLFKHPGTHILNYFIPLYIIAGYGFIYLLDLVKYKLIKNIVAMLVILYLAVFVGVQIYIFTPIFNANYPWDGISVYKFSSPNSAKYQTFLYGFPYNRGWADIRAKMFNFGDVDTFYTNDNAVVAKYYLKEFAISPPGGEFLPKYYIEVPFSQEFKVTPASILDNYTIVDQIKLGHLDPVLIYKLKKS